MGIIAEQRPTLMDVASRTEDNKIGTIAELLTENNEILTDMVMKEGNLPTGNKTTVRTGLPQATWRLLNYGVQPSKSKTAQITDTCGMLEAYAEVDKALADLNGNTSSFRLSEDMAFLEAMNQEMAKTLFYGDTSVDPEKFVGLAPRYNTLNAKKAETAKNVLDAKGTANLTSIYLVVWGANTVHGIFPKGSTAGLKHDDKGQVTIQDANGGNYEGYRTHYKWDLGLTVRDWRYVVRIANIDVNALTKDASAGADLIDLMTTAEELIPNLNAGRACWYMNRQVRTFLRKQKNNAHKYQITEGNEGGMITTEFDGIPVRRVDALINTEAQVR